MKFQKQYVSKNFNQILFLVNKCIEKYKLQIKTAGLPSGPEH